MTKGRTEIRIGGSGGQGILTTGILLGEAAVLYDHQYAVQTQAYGPESRGGASKTDVIISREEIDFPEIHLPGIVAVLSVEAYRKFARTSDSALIRIIDSSIALDPTDIIRPPSFTFPIIDIAVKELGTLLTANVVLLGIIAGISGVVSLPAVELAVENRFAKRKPTLNLQALRRGYELAAAYRPQLEKSNATV